MPTESHHNTAKSRREIVLRDLQTLLNSIQKNLFLKTNAESLALQITALTYPRGHKKPVLCQSTAWGTTSQKIHALAFALTSLAAELAHPKQPTPKHLAHATSRILKAAASIQKAWTENRLITQNSVESTELPQILTEMQKADQHPEKEPRRKSAPVAIESDPS